MRRVNFLSASCFLHNRRLLLKAFTHSYIVVITEFGLQSVTFRMLRWAFKYVRNVRLQTKLDGLTWKDLFFSLQWTVQPCLLKQKKMFKKVPQLCQRMAQRRCIFLIHDGDKRNELSLVDPLRLPSAMFSTQLLVVQKAMDSRNGHTK